MEWFFATASATPAEVAAAFTGAPVPLAMVREVRVLRDGRYEAVTGPL